MRNYFDLMRFVVAAFVIAVVDSVTFAQAPPALVREINNPVPSVADNFGRNFMVTHHGRILCGAAGSEVESEGFSNSGIAYLINGQTGELELTMPNPEPDTNVGFGAFSWAGDTKLIVSAIGKSDGATTGSGRVYVFNMADGVHTHTIHNPTPGSVEWFGYGLGMIGDMAIVGAPGDSTAGAGTGAVYTFDSLTGGMIKTIINPEPTTADGFGYSVAGLGNDRIAVGAPGTDVGSTDAGAVYIIDAASGVVLHKILHPEPNQEGYFGFQIRAHGENVLIGSPGSNKAYLYDSISGQQLLRFENPLVKEGAFFGSTVASAGRYILIGNPLEPVGEETWVGKAYLYDSTSGDLVHTFQNPTPAQEERFGVSVAGLDGNIIISADQNSVAGVPLAGTIYVYSGPRTGACCEWQLFE